MKLKTWSYRFAEEVINSKLSLKKEIEETLTDKSIDSATLTRPGFNSALRQRFVSKGWKDQPSVFDLPDDPEAKMDFLKDRVGIEVCFGHASFIGIDLLKFQVASYSGLDKIDLGVYIVTTREFQNHLRKQYSLNWEGSLNYEKVCKYLPHFKSAIQVPIWVVGLEA